MNLFSIRESWSAGYAGGDEGNQYEQNSQKQYDYWKSGNSKIAYKHSSTGTAVWWWRRSPCFGTTTDFSSTYTGGSRSSSTASWSAGVVAGFAA